MNAWRLLYGFVTLGFLGAANGSVGSLVQIEPKVYFPRLIIPIDVQINNLTKNLRGFQNLWGLAANIFLKIYISALFGGFIDLMIAFLVLIAMMIFEKQ